MTITGRRTAARRRSRVEVPSKSSASAPRARIEILRTTLSNGMVVLGRENHTHPAVVLRLTLRASPLHDTADRAGLASLTASALTRGTRTRSFEEINELVDASGMGLSAGAGRHVSSVSTRCLVEDLPLAIDLLSDITRNPSFPEAQIAQLRGQALTGLRQADSDTGAVAERTFRELIYPKNHPYRLRTYGYLDTVARLTRDELADFHARAYGAESAFIVAVGDFDFTSLVQQLEEAFAGWQGHAPPKVKLPDPKAPKPVEREVEVAGKTQSDLVVGLPSIRRSDPDYYALRMANLVFGRLGMMGRLGDSVREAQGLAYRVYSELDAGLGPGPWSVRAGVNPVNVTRALAAIQREIKRLRDGGVTRDELLRGQRYSTGTLVLHLETNDGVANLIQEIELYGLGLDYVERYPAIVNSLTRDAVNAAAAKHIPQFEEAVRVVAGPARSA